MRVATTRNTSSPALCPKMSLISLKWSRSQNSKPTSESWRVDRAQRVFEAIDEQPPVRQSGEVIVQRTVLALALGLTPFGEVDRDGQPPAVGMQAHSRRVQVRVRSIGPANLEFATPNVAEGRRRDQQQVSSRVAQPECRRRARRGRVRACRALPRWRRGFDASLRNRRRTRSMRISGGTARQFGVRDPARCAAHEHPTSRPRIPRRVPA